MLDLQDRVAVVTGAASGIGRAIARRFVADGMKVVVSDIDDAAIARAVDELRAVGGDVVGVRADVGERAGVERLAAATIAAFGKVNVLCNNAGIVIGGRIELLTEAEWRRVIDIDLWGPIHGVRTFLPLIEAAGEGHIVSTSSTSGLGAPPFIAPYAVAKAGVIGLMESLRRELDERSSPIGASVLCPGPVKTSLMAASAELAKSIDDRSNTHEGAEFARTSGNMLQLGGKEPAEIASMVRDAIIENRFWIITHAEWGDVLRTRVDLMLDDGSLAPRPKASTD